MKFLWPGFLVGLSLIPFLIFVYWWAQRRLRHPALRYSSLALVRAARPGPAGLRKHVPPALFLAAIASLGLSLARPVLVRPIPIRLATVILAIDVSDSMRYEDVKPNRLLAAEDAALSFVQKQQGKAQIGIVEFTNEAQLILPPSTDSIALENAVRSLTTGEATAIGSGIITSIAAIDQAKPSLYKSQIGSGGNNRYSASPYSPDYIVLLTDGANNMGPSPLSAARVIARQGVRIFTIGFGAHQGPSKQKDLPGKQAMPGRSTKATSPAENEIDEKTLKEIAAITGGKYFSAGSAYELENVFAGLPTIPVIRKDLQEVSVAFVALGALLSAIAITLSILWHPLP